MGREGHHAKIFRQTFISHSNFAHLKPLIDELNKNPNRDINNFFLANERHSGYCVARDMLIRFIREKQ